LIALLGVTTILYSTISSRSENKMENYYGKDELVLDGVIMSHFITANTEFKKKQENLKDFRVLILETEEEYRITFVPKRAPGEKPTLGGRTSLGQSISYYISKKDNNITRWHFHK
jgi:hypothetical protein